MANTTVYPFGTDGTLPGNIGIINDLKTGGVGSALSAEQGVVINEKFGTISSLKSTGRNDASAISSDGTIVSGAAAAYVLTFNCEENKLLFASGRVGSATGYLMVAFYDENGDFISGALPYGTASNPVNYHLVSPAGTKTVKVAGNYDLGGVAALSILYEDTLQHRVSELEGRVIKKIFSITDITSCGATITNENVWLISPYYYGALIPVSAYRGKVISITANDTQACPYAYLKSGVDSGNTPDYATGYTKRLAIPATETKMTVVPEDAVYLYVYMQSNSIVYTPSDVSVCDYLNNIDQGEDSESISLMSYNIGHFSGGVSPNSSITSSNYVSKLNDFRSLLSNERPDIFGVVEYSEIFGKNTNNQDVEAKDVLFNLATEGFISTQLHYACYSLFANRQPIYNITINDFDCLENETITHTTLIEAQDYRYISADLYAFGVCIKFIVTHLAFDQNRPGVLQEAQLNELITKYASYPYVVMMGDFNINAEDIASTMENAGYTMANDGSLKTMPSAERGHLDNIMVKGLSLHSVRMVSSNLSDHNPLFARIAK